MHVLPHAKYAPSNVTATELQDLTASVNVTKVMGVNTVTHFVPIRGELSRTTAVNVSLVSLVNRVQKTSLTVS